MEVIWLCPALRGGGGYDVRCSVGRERGCGSTFDLVVELHARRAVTPRSRAAPRRRRTEHFRPHP